ncbi:uncharacterized protein [Aegilops tauschii subsp. strangulata]|nr:uncharacterized protein LOC123078403 isoform X3 [Triticum aestivum]XP_045090733.1 uncharacterized protein LOC109739069 isoform X3 [Aegilops tauschii subsp. strangulata]
MGGIYHEILPKSEYFSKALYTFHFAQNDLTLGYFTNKTTKQIEAYDPDPKERFTVAMQEVGAKVESLQRLFTRKVVFSKTSLAFEQDRSIKLSSYCTSGHELQVVLGFDCWMEQHQERALLLQPHGSKQAWRRPRGLISDQPHV